MRVFRLFPKLKFVLMLLGTQGIFLSCVLATPPLPAVVAAGGAGAMGVSPPEVTDAIKKALTFNFSGTNVWLQEIRFKQVSGADVAPGAPAKSVGPINGNSPVLVHVIVFMDDAAFKAIGAMNSDEYFKKSEQLERDYRSTIEVFKFEIPPGVKVDPQTISPKNVMGVGCGVFARYKSPGAHRYNVGSDRVIEIELGPTDFKVNTIKQ